MALENRVGLPGGARRWRRKPGEQRGSAPTATSRNAMRERLTARTPAEPRSHRRYRRRIRGSRELVGAAEATPNSCCGGGVEASIGGGGVSARVRGRGRPGGATGARGLTPAVAGGCSGSIAICGRPCSRRRGLPRRMNAWGRDGSLPPSRRPRPGSFAGRTPAAKQAVAAAPPPRQIVASLPAVPIPASFASAPVPAAPAPRAAPARSPPAPGRRPRHRRRLPGWRRRVARPDAAASPRRSASESRPSAIAAAPGTATEAPMS